MSSSLTRKPFKLLKPSQESIKLTDKPRNHLSNRGTNTVRKDRRLFEVYVDGFKVVCFNVIILIFSQSLFQLPASI